jgi:hypothetical protein
MKYLNHSDFCGWHVDQRDADCTCGHVAGVDLPNRQPAPAPVPRERQSRADSFMEAVVNILIGLAVSQAANLIVLPLVFGVPVSQGQALALGVIYTAISLARSYALRRAFNGRSPWAAIKAALS